jgi:UDP-N-acetylmuramate: L-alanyl-gamma-D-glutamyl-meso-diaminopimelate ligase
MSTLRFPDVKHVHFIGVCGTAMGSVAALVRDEGFKVTGSDAAVYPPMSTFLRGKGIGIQDGYKAENLDPAPDLVVVGNAISRGNPELEAVLNRKLYYVSLPELLKFFFLRKGHNLIVTGTHGKTTTTSLLAWLFQHAGKEPSYMIGGIPLNLGQGCRRQKDTYWILEGDEYDTSFFDKRSKFLHYLPELAVINNIEFDHADIYDSLDAIKLAFRRLVDLVPSNGMLLVNGDDPHAVEVTRKAQAPITEVGFSQNCGLRISNLRADPHGSHFDFLGLPFTVPLYGQHNVRNAAMAVAAAHFYQLPLPELQAGLQAFQGVKRRLETRFENKGVTVVDDFGHHPTALRETIGALRQKFPGRRLWALFEPRSNTTRRAVFQNDLPAALALADGVFVSQVARLEQIPAEQRLNPEKLVADIAAAGRPSYYEADADAIIGKLVPLLQPGDVVGVFSNGSFGGLIDKLQQKLAS